MEGLLIIGAELLLFPFIAGLAALGELILSLLSLILQLLLKSAPKRSRLRLKLSPALIKWIQRITLSTLALFAVALLLLNFVFLNSTVRFAFDKLEDSTGFTVRYDKMTGNVFTGHFSFTDLDINQTRNDKPQLSLQAQQFSANLSVWRFIFGSRTLDSAQLSGAQIHLQPLPAPEEESAAGFTIGLAWKDKVFDGSTFAKASLLDTPNYTINDLQLDNIHIRVNDRDAPTPTSYEIKIDRFSAQPLRSHFAIFDLLFRSNLEGQLNQSRLEILNTKSEKLRHTRWKTENVSAATLASLVGGPFHLFEYGTVDVEVTDRWESSHVEMLDLDWRIKVSETKARLPDDTPQFLKPLAQVWVDNINENERDWVFAFQLQLAEKQFRGASSLNAQQIWANSLPVILKQIADATGAEESTLKEKAKSVFDAAKSFLRNRND